MMKKLKSVDDINPLGIFLVKSGSKGHRLLFRYPYWVDANIESVTRKKKNPYGIIITEDPLNAPRTQPNPSELRDQQLVGFSDKVLSNLFAVKPYLCAQKFELKVNDVRFVGHPTLLATQNTSILMFNIVFALKASANQAVVECYHDFTQRLAIALQHEERRCAYLSTQAKIMMATHDEVVAMPEAEAESPYHLILSRSQLAKDLQATFTDLTETGEVHLQIQKWIDVSFCLPHKVHLRHNSSMIIGPEAIQSCLTALRPYHGLLLLPESGDLVESFPQDASPALIRLVQEARPLKSLQRLSADADLTLTQVFQLAGHLVYWAKAIIIYPLCESNVYILSPSASLSMSSPLAEIFAERFLGHSLLTVLSEFSLPVSLSQLSNPMQSPHQQGQQIQMVVWLLQHGLLMQLHTYVYLVSSARQPSSLLLGMDSQNSSANTSLQPALGNGRMSADEMTMFDQSSNPSEFGSSDVQPLADDQQPEEEPIAAQSVSQNLVQSEEESEQPNNQSQISQPRPIASTPKTHSHQIIPSFTSFSDDSVSTSALPSTSDTQLPAFGDPVIPPLSPIPKPKIPLLHKPFQLGWSRRVSVRSRQSLRSRPEIIKFLQTHPNMPLTIDNFDFREKMVYQPPLEFITYADQ